MYKCCILYMLACILYAGIYMLVYIWMMCWASMNTVTHMDDVLGEYLFGGVFGHSGGP